MSYIINGKSFSLIDTLEKIPSKDSFTHQDNKLGAGAGAWEWHIGSKNDISRYAFFGGEGFNVRCFLKKTDLIWLMNELQTEYFLPTQNYRGVGRFNQIWQERLDEINQLSDYIFFQFREHDRRAATDMRLYAKRPNGDAEGDDYYGLIRRLALPNITFVSILKLEASDGEVLFYFKIFPEFIDKIIEQPKDLEIIRSIKESSIIPELEKMQLIKARIGQGVFRAKLIEECKFCPITLVDDSRILIASHIKPWKVSLNNERLDVLNGFLFTPTFDKLFDAGYITFSIEKRLMISPWISNETCRKLHISDNLLFPQLPLIGREDYLEFHKENIFKT